MKKSTIICALLFMSVILYSKEYNTTRRLINTQQTNTLKINTFTKIPNEIEGCVLYLYRSKNDKKRDKYICVTDFAHLAFVSIDNRLTKFMLDKHHRAGKTDIFLFESESLQLKIEIKTSKGTGSESALMTGMMTVKTSGNKKTILNFIGKMEC